LLSKNKIKFKALIISGDIPGFSFKSDGGGQVSIKKKATERCRAGSRAAEEKPRDSNEGNDATNGNTQLEKGSLQRRGTALGLRSRTEQYALSPFGTLTTRLQAASLPCVPSSSENLAALDAYTKAQEFLRGRFFPSVGDPLGKVIEQTTATLVGSESRPKYSETALFGHSLGQQSSIYLNVAEPFCMVALGVQGSGKSHTVATVVESCLLNFDMPAEDPLIRIKTSMAVLAMHFGKTSDDACELAGLMKPLPELKAILGHAAPCAERVVVLVSPSYFNQRVAYYEGNADVFPLLFRWSKLSAAHLRALMRLDDDNSQQLYVSVALDLLRRYQKEEKIPDFNDFMAEIEDLCASNSQAGPLRQRLQLLESFVVEAKGNEIFRGRHMGLEDCVAPGVLVIADLTDPLMSSADANGIFTVLLEQFRSVRGQNESETVAKLCVLDEAHRYLSGKGGLAAGVVDAVRVMRHDGMRVLLSTQSPLTLPPEVLELTSMAVLHGFHSADWYTHLASKLALPPNGFVTIRQLAPGDALVFAPKKHFNPLSSSVQQESVPTTTAADPDLLVVRVRKRLTADLGASLSSSSS
jgi:hypothetical protein